MGKRGIHLTHFRVLCILLYGYGIFLRLFMSLFETKLTNARKQDLKCSSAYGILKII